MRKDFQYCQNTSKVLKGQKIDRRRKQVYLKNISRLYLHLEQVAKLAARRIYSKLELKVVLDKNIYLSVAELNNRFWSI